MAWTAHSLQPELPIVEMVVSGSITHADSDDMRAAVRVMLSDEGLSRVFYDATDLRHVPTSTDIITVADSIVATHVPDGIRTAVFHTRDEAVDWLLAE